MGLNTDFVGAICTIIIIIKRKEKDWGGTYVKILDEHTNFTNEIY